MWLIVVIVSCARGNRTGAWLFLPTCLHTRPAVSRCPRSIRCGKEKRNETKGKMENGKWKINAKLPGRWLRPSFTASDSQFPLPDRMPVEAGLVRQWIPGTQHRQGPSPMVPQASQRPLIARSLRFVWHAPLSRSKGGAPAGGAGGTHLDRGPPAASQSARLRSSPPLSANLIRESGQGIGAAYLAVVFFGRAFPRWSVPGHPLPSPFFFNHFLHPPPSRPQILHLAPRTPPPPRGPLTPCTTLPCILAPDAIVGQTVCGYLPVTSGTVDDPPLPPPPSSPRPPASGHGWAHPSSTANPGKDILQSAICNLRPPADTGQRGNHLNGPTSYHIGTAAGCVAFADLASSTL